METAFKIIAKGVSCILDIIIILIPFTYKLTKQTASIFWK